jgi:hypothetical protein
VAIVCKASDPRRKILRGSCEVHVGNHVDLTANLDIPAKMENANRPVTVRE